MNNFPIYIIFVVLNLLFICTITYSHNVHHLQPGGKVNFDPESRLTKKLEIYCYDGRPKFIVNLWQTVILKINSQSNSFEIYEGKTSDQVASEYDGHRSTWSYNFFSTKAKSVKLDPFSPSCVGVESSLPYSVELLVIRVDYWKVLFLLCGIILFLSAPKLAENALFYYICGVSFGITASFLILIYFVSKLFPKRPIMYGFIAGGWAIGAYLLQLLWENLRIITETYKTYVFYYIFGTGLFSFVICYRLGPPTNPRSKNLIRWTLMIFGLLIIFNSSYFQEAVMGIIVLLVIAYNFPKVWIAKSRTYCTDAEEN